MTKEDDALDAADIAHERIAALEAELATAKAESSELRELLIVKNATLLSCVEMICPECGEEMTSRLGTELKLSRETAIARAERAETESRLLREQLRLAALPVDSRDGVGEDLSWMTLEDAIAHYECAMLNWNHTLDMRDELTKRAERAEAERDEAAVVGAACAKLADALKVRAESAEAELADVSGTLAACEALADDFRDKASARLSETNRNLAERDATIARVERERDFLDGASRHQAAVIRKLRGALEGIRDGLRGEGRGLGETWQVDLDAPPSTTKKLRRIVTAALATPPSDEAKEDDGPGMCMLGYCNRPATKLDHCEEHFAEVYGDARGEVKK